MDSGNIDSKDPETKSQAIAKRRSSALLTDLESLHIRLHTPALPESNYSIFSVGDKLFEVENRYIIRDILGHGAYGIVTSAYDKITNSSVGIKKIETILEHKTVTKRTLREIIFLRWFSSSDNIMKLLRIMKPKEHTFEDVYLITELMETDLDQIIRSPQNLTDEHCQFFIFQLLKGVRAMHHAGVMHRDLKPRNLLINSNCDLKICDFGLARLEKMGFSSTNMTDYVATRWYRAPEVLLASRSYSKAVDLWAVGCILAELIGRKPIFPGKDGDDQLTKIINLLGTPKNKDLMKCTNLKAISLINTKLLHRKHIPFTRLYPRANPDACDLLEKLLVFDPEKRITVDTALAHPYLATFASDNNGNFSTTIEINELDWLFENYPVSQNLLRDLIYRESLYYYPEEKIPDVRDVIELHLEETRRKNALLYKRRNSAPNLRISISSSDIDQNEYK